MKTSWLTVLSVVVFTVASGVTVCFPGTFAASCASFVVYISGVFGHIAQPVVKPLDAAEGNRV